MADKVKIAVVMGGPSKEHEVSLNSGQNMYRSLDNGKFEIVQIVINKSGEWLFGDDKTPLGLAAALERLKTDRVEVVVLALHGTFGEDGVLQALLESSGIKFTGSAAVASMLAMDKSASNALFKAAGLMVPKSRIYEASEAAGVPAKIGRAFALPLVVKPLRQGSSVGVGIVKVDKDLPAAVRDAFNHGQMIMVQEYIAGREVSCGVLERGGQPYALPPTELIPLKADFFDYNSKYDQGGADEITPPDMPPAVLEEIQAAAVTAHKALGCRAYSRTDMIVNERGVYLIETNTLPGMTATSILPQQARAAGMSFEELMEYLVESAA